MDDDGGAFIAGIFFGGLIIGLFFLLMMPAMFVWKGPVDNAGKMFCNSYGLEYSYLTTKDNAMQFVCANNTETKIDTIGKLITGDGTNG